MNPKSCENINYFDTHAHLYSLKERTLEEMLNLATHAGVQKIVTITTAESDFNLNIEIAKKYDFIYTTQGIHPHSASEFKNEIKELILQNIKNYPGKIKAIGEIGLDYHYLLSPREVQIKVFEEFLELASKLKLPVVIHSREADEDMASILQNFRAGLPKIPGVLHSFSSTEELAEKALNLGFYLGLNGIVTFKKAENVRRVALTTPLSQMVLETDAPYLAPIPHRGKENSPHFLPLIAAKIAEIRGQDLNEIISITYQNSFDLFQIDQRDEKQPS